VPLWGDTNLWGDSRLWGDEAIAPAPPPPPPGQPPVVTSTAAQPAGILVTSETQRTGANIVTRDTPVAAPTLPPAPPEPPPPPPPVDPSLSRPTLILGVGVYEAYVF
jgi:hypothetical protein